MSREPARRGSSRKEFTSCNQNVFAAGRVVSAGFPQWGGRSRRSITEKQPSYLYYPKSQEEVGWCRKHGIASSEPVDRLNPLPDAVKLEQSQYFEEAIAQDMLLTCPDNT